MAAVVFLWCQAQEVVVVFWERPVAAVVGGAGGAADGCRVRGVVPRRRALGCDSAACFARPCPNNNSPDRSSSPCPGAPRMRRFYISAWERRTLAARDSISSVLHAASNPFCPGVFSDLRDTEAKRTAQRSPNTPRVLRAESRAIFSCVKRLHTANKQGALCERCVTARDVDARYKQDGVKPWAAAKQSTASPTTTRARCTRTIRTAGDWCGCET